MAKLFDQAFRVGFTLNAYIVGGSTVSDDTPANVEMEYTRTGGYSNYTIFRLLYIINLFKDEGTIGYHNRLVNVISSTHPYAPYVWANGVTGPNVVDSVSFSDNASVNPPTGYRCTLLFGDLNLALTDEMIDKINDSTRPVFSLTTNVGDQRVTLKSFNKFRTARYITRRTYDYLGRQRSSKSSELLTTDSTLEIPIELELTASRSTAGGGVTYTYKPTQKIYTIKSTGEVSTSW